MKILTGNSNRPLAEAISAKLALPLIRANIRRFADNEIFVEILENVRGEDVFVIQSTSSPANDHLMELLITIDALRRSSARRITAVIPYFGYARQDRRIGRGAFGRRRDRARLPDRALGGRGRAQRARLPQARRCRGARRHRRAGPPHRDPRRPDRPVAA